MFLRGRSISPSSEMWLSLCQIGTTKRVTQPVPLDVLRTAATGLSFLRPTSPKYLTNAFLHKYTAVLASMSQFCTNFAHPANSELDEKLDTPYKSAIEISSINTTRYKRLLRDAVPSDHLKELLQLMQTRCQAVIDANRMQT